MTLTTIRVLEGSLESAESPSAFAGAGCENELGRVIRQPHNARLLAIDPFALAESSREVNLAVIDWSAHKSVTFCEHSA